MTRKEEILKIIGGSTFQGNARDVVLKELLTLFDQKLKEEYERGARNQALLDAKTIKEERKEIMEIKAGENLGLGKLNHDERVAISGFKEYVKHLLKTKYEANKV